MKNIAFKRAKSSPSVAKNLHSDFIIDYVDTTLFPEGFHTSEQGYEILGEDLFDLELNKNDQLHLAFLEKKRKDEIDLQNATSDLLIQEQAQERKDLREYEEFKKWKKMKGNRR